MTDKYSKRTRGFTLVELSIVIIIIGFLIAGVTAGKSLINAAQLSSIISDYQQFQLAYTGFVDRYRAVPGDMINATSYWPNDGTCGETAANCNGNGNGLIQYSNGNGPTQYGREMHAFWKQLSLSGLISANFTVVPDTYAGQDLGINIYPSKITGAGYSAASDLMSRFIGYEHPWFIYQGADLKTNAIFLAKSSSYLDPIDPEFDMGVITVFDAFNLDKKMDNGTFDANNNPIGGHSGRFRAQGLEHVINWAGCLVWVGPGELWSDVYNFPAGLNCIVGVAMTSGLE